MDKAPVDELFVSEKFAIHSEPVGSIVANGSAVVISGIDGDGQEGAHATAGESGIAIAGRRATAQTGTYGISIAGDGGSAVCIQAGAAIVAGDGCAESGDGSISFVRSYKGQASTGNGGVAICNHDGTARAGIGGIAYVESGSAVVEELGIALVRAAADEVSAGAGGISVAWVSPAAGGPADPALIQSISAGEGGLIISFIIDAKGHRQPVVGFVGGIAMMAQGGLQPGTAYKLSAQGEFVPV